MCAFGPGTGTTAGTTAGTTTGTEAGTKAGTTAGTKAGTKAGTGKVGGRDVGSESGVGAKEFDSRVYGPPQVGRLQCSTIATRCAPVYTVVLCYILRQQMCSWFAVLLVFCVPALRASCVAHACPLWQRVCVLPSKRRWNGRQRYCRDQRR